jgi:hypothetical protein
MDPIAIKIAARLLANVASFFSTQGKSDPPSPGFGQVKPKQIARTIQIRDSTGDSPILKARKWQSSFAYIHF